MVTASRLGNRTVFLPAHTSFNGLERKCAIRLPGTSSWPGDDLATVRSPMIYKRILEEMLPKVVACFP